MTIRKTFMGVSIGVGVLIVSLIGTVLLFIGAIIFAFGFHNFTTSDQPTRKSIGGLSAVALKNYWLEQPAVASYEFEAKDWGPRDTLGGKRYLVDYNLVIELKKNYTYTDPEAFLQAAVDSIWYTNDKAPQGNVKVTIIAPGSQPIKWGGIIDSVVAPEARSYNFTDKPSTAASVEATADVFEQYLGPWTGGEKPVLEGLFRLRDPRNEADAVKIVPGLDEKSIMRISNQLSDNGKEQFLRSCVSLYGLYGSNDDLNSIYRMPVELKVYENGNLLKTIEVVRNESDEDFWDATYRFSQCYDEQWDFPKITGTLEWPESEGYSGGTEAAELKIDDLSSFMKD